MALVLFARIGWMRWYKGPQECDKKPVGGGKYNKDSLGLEAYNFLPLNGKMLGYFQPQLQPPDRHKTNPSSIALERIKAGWTGNSLSNVLTVFFATDPTRGGQRNVGWFPSSTVYRHSQESHLKAREGIPYYVMATEGDEVLVPEERREFTLPSGKGGVGTANVCYALKQDGQPKQHSDWIAGALAYIGSYDQDPSSEVAATIASSIAGTMENAQGFQSNPRIRKATEEYAMAWAHRHLTKLKYAPRDMHKDKPYDFICTINGAEVFVEVKGTQGNGRAISLTPREVEHAQRNRNFALVIVHSVKVHGKRRPTVSGGKLRFLYPWNIGEGILKPRGFVLTISEQIFSGKAGELIV